MKKAIMLGLLLAASSTSFVAEAFIFGGGGCCGNTCAVRTCQPAPCCRPTCCTVRYVQPVRTCCTYVKRTYYVPRTCCQKVCYRQRCGC